MLTQSITLASTDTKHSILKSRYRLRNIPSLSNVLLSCFIYDVENPVLHPYKVPRRVLSALSLATLNRYDACLYPQPPWLYSCTDKFIVEKPYPSLSKLKEPIFKHLLAGICIMPETTLYGDINKLAKSFVGITTLLPSASNPLRLVGIPFCISFSRISSPMLCIF